MNRQKLIKFLLRYRIVWFGMVAGAAFGYFWYVQVGCANGTCLISSNPLRSTAYFAVVGALFAHSFVKKESSPQSIRIGDQQQ